MACVIRGKYRGKNRITSYKHWFLRFTTDQKVGGSNPLAHGYLKSLRILVNTKDSEAFLFCLNDHFLSHVITFKRGESCGNRGKIVGKISHIIPSVWLRSAVYHHQSDHKYSRLFLYRHVPSNLLQFAHQLLFS